MRAAADEAGRDPDGQRVVVRLVESAGRGPEIAAAIPALEAAGVGELIVNVDWDADPAEQFRAMAA
jgi:hypothetical protein